MGEKIHNKLVRDKIPEFLEARGIKAESRILTEDEYRLALLEKLVEEAIELRDSNGSIDERADVKEVLKSIDDLFDYGDENLEKVRAEKAAERGGFADKVFLEKTSE